METHGSIQGTQEDLDRWYSFIASVKPAVIHAGGMQEPTFDMPDEIAAELFSIVKNAKFTPITKNDDKNPSSGAPDWVVGCDSDGNVLFDIFYKDGVSVSFDDSGKSYSFDANRSSIEQISAYMYADYVY